MDFGTSPQKQQELERRMAHLGIREADILETFVRSSGHGGQNVNKVATCVVLHHRPTGIVVKCSRERSQALNRFLARRILCEKIDAAVHSAQSEERQRIAKLRRQKRRRSRRAREKVLADKHHRSMCKSSRKHREMAE